MLLTTWNSSRLRFVDAVSYTKRCSLLSSAERHASARTFRYEEASRGHRRRTVFSFPPATRKPAPRLQRRGGCFQKRRAHDNLFDARGSRGVAPCILNTRRTPNSPLPRRADGASCLDLQGMEIDLILAARVQRSYLV